ncbi:hypothetical protein ACJJIW_05310 [Microbulbifer sp. JMSA004]|uniref:hypothetical protein n=1 Tax=Microbulbifer sp. JMSA004 TaxID=3243370 RepID=UPI00403A55B2
MEIISVWLIEHKASLDEFSPMNEDGSEFMVGTGFVPASSQEDAMSLFEQYLDKQGMKILELKSCKQYDPADFSESSKDDKRVMLAASSSMEDEQIRYIGISSEAMDCDEVGRHEQ